MVPKRTPRDDVQRTDETGAERRQQYPSIRRAFPFLAAVFLVVIILLY
jgi:hypothetical protein